MVSRHGVATSYGASHGRASRSALPSFAVRLCCKSLKSIEFQAQWTRRTACFLMKRRIMVLVNHRTPNSQLELVVRQADAHNIVALVHPAILAQAGFPHQARGGMARATPYICRAHVHSRRAAQAEEGRPCLSDRRVVIHFPRLFRHVQGRAEPRPQLYA